MFVNVLIGLNRVMCLGLVYCGPIRSLAGSSKAFASPDKMNFVWCGVYFVMSVMKVSTVSL